MCSWDNVKDMWWWWQNMCLSLWFSKTYVMVLRLLLPIHFCFGASLLLCAIRHCPFTFHISLIHTHTYMTDYTDYHAFLPSASFFIFCHIFHARLWQKEHELLSGHESNCLFSLDKWTLWQRFIDFMPVVSFSIVKVLFPSLTFWLIHLSLWDSRAGQVKTIRVHRWSLTPSVFLWTSFGRHTHSQLVDPKPLCMQIRLGSD